MSFHTLPSLGRETTDDFSAMYTYILDEDDSPTSNLWKTSNDVSDVELPKLSINTKFSRTPSFYRTVQTSPTSTDSAYSPSPSSDSLPESNTVSPNLSCIAAVDEEGLQDVANRLHFSEHFFRATRVDPCVDPVDLSLTLKAEDESSFVNRDLQDTTMTPDQMHIHRLILMQEEPKNPNVVKDTDGALMVFNRSTNKIHYECEECPDKVFGRIHDWRRHKQSSHSNSGWPCEFCGHKFARRDALLRHFKAKAIRKDGMHPTGKQKHLQKEAIDRIKKMTRLQEENEQEKV